MNKLVVPLFAGFTCGLLAPQVANAQKPNILIIVADDMGYSDAGNIINLRIKQMSNNLLMKRLN